MKNRIWKKILATGVSLLAQFGLLTGCTVQPEVVYGAEMGGGMAAVAQEAAWTDQEKFQALVSVRAEGLAGLDWNGENREESWSSSENMGEDQDGFSDHTYESTTVPTSYELVVWISEYFQPDPLFTVPEGCVREELPITTADGRSSSITGFRWRINQGEGAKQLDIPVTLREEYRFPAVQNTVPTCQLALPTDGILEGEESGGGIYIVRKTGSRKEILCKAAPKSLEIPAAVMDFSMEMNPEESTILAGDRILMDVSLTNSGQVTLYDISLQAQVKDMETAPVWEKEPGLEITENGAVLKSLTAGEKRTVSFYVDTADNQKGGLVLEARAKTDNPVSLEKTTEQQLTVQPRKASFTVKKTADCENASPGDTVTYQISIHNTGEQTLHSVITTERFGLAGVTATFLSQEGVTLNKSKTQAKIPEIVPGGCVNLKAQVVLPKDLEDQDLVNQIIVVTDETGEESVVRDQATIRVEKKDGSGNGNGSGGDGSGSAASTSPKTGDRSHKEVFQALILLSFFFSAVSARRMFFRRKD